MNKPPYFYGSCYKYRQFGSNDSAEREHLRALILERQMMFSSPNKFNDPYDCRPTFIRGNNPAQDRARITRAWEEGRRHRGAPKPTQAKKSQHVTEVMRQLSTPEGAAAHFKPYLDENTGVFCMSKEWNLLTQWAYYADNGRGLCLEYDVTPEASFDRVFEIKYSDTRPHVQIARMLSDDNYRTEALFAAVTHKALDWSHEKEVRALHNRPGIYEHPAGLLKSVMVGTYASQENIEWLVQVLSSEPKIQIYQVELTENSFTLERHPLT